MLKILSIDSSYGKATKVEETIEEKIHSCEKQMTEILAELNELVGSEEKNRIEMELLKEQHRSCTKKSSCASTFLWNDG